MNKQEVIKQLIHATVKVWDENDRDIREALETGFNEAIALALKYINQLDEPQKVVIPLR